MDKLTSSVSSVGGNKDREIQQLRDLLVQRESQIAELEMAVAQMAGLKEALAQSEREMVMMRDRKRQAAQERDEQARRAGLLEKELADQRQRTSDLERELSDLRDQKTLSQQESSGGATAAEEACRLRKELEQAQRDARDAEGAARRKDELMLQVNADREELYREITVLRESNTTLSKEVERLTEEMGAFAAQEDRAKTGATIAESRRRDEANLNACQLPERALKANADFHRRFPELPDDTLVEYFMCSQGEHGTSPGYVYVARRHVCWQSYGIGSSKIVVPLARIAALDKVKATKIFEGFFFDLVCTDPGERVNLHSVGWKDIVRSILRQAKASGVPMRFLHHGKDKTILL
eukprot:m51a1_g8333 hypothetical protein (352) ;mRNA; r:168541-169919